MIGNSTINNKIRPTAVGYDHLPGTEFADYRGSEIMDYCTYFDGLWRNFAVTLQRYDDCIVDGRIGYYMQVGTIIDRISGGKHRRN